MRDQASYHAPYRAPYDADFGLTTADRRWTLCAGIEDEDVCDSVVNDGWKSRKLAAAIFAIVAAHSGDKLTAGLPVSRLAPLNGCDAV
jgi:hypothetical protein